MNYKFLKMANEADSKGDLALAGVFRVEAENDRKNHIKVHRPTLGPYTPASPQTCEDCHKLLRDVSMDEACAPRASS